MALKLKKKRIPALIGIGVGTVFAAYTVFCLCVSGQDFLSNTTINGIDVSDMTKQEAIDALSKKYEKDKQQLLLNIDLGEQKYTLDFRDIASFDVENEVNKLYDYYHPFFTRAIRFFDNEKTIGVTISDEEAFHKIVEDSKILDYSSLVPTTYEIKDDSVEFKKGVSGVKFDSKKAYEQIHELLTNYTFTDKIELETVKVKEDASVIDTIYEQTSQDAKNATLDKNNGYALVDERYGAKFNVDDAKKMFKDTKEGKTFNIKAEILKPEVTKAQLQANLYKDVLATYTTTVTGSSTRRNNVRLAGTKCNLIMLPGDEFSYNQTVGKRTTEAGFGAAGAYLNGETIQEVGGGICQTSSTLYNAVVLSNLEVLERKCHTYQSGYVPIGRDATVSWGGPDFRFKNNTNYPIKIITSYANDKITCKILGTNLDGTYVKFTSEQTATIPYTEKREDDPNVDKGTEVVKEAGSNGAKAVSYRFVYDKNGNLISKNKESSSYYKPHTRVIGVGTREPVAQPVPEAGTTGTDPSTNTTTPEANATTTPAPTTPAQ